MNGLHDQATILWRSLTLVPFDDRILASYAPKLAVNKARNKSHSNRVKLASTQMPKFGTYCCPSPPMPWRRHTDGRLSVDRVARPRTSSFPIRAIERRFRHLVSLRSPRNEPSSNQQNQLRLDCANLSLSGALRGRSHGARTLMFVEQATRARASFTHPLSKGTTPRVEDRPSIASLLVSEGGGVGFRHRIAGRNGETSGA